MQLGAKVVGSVAADRDNLSEQLTCEGQEMFNLTRSLLELVGTKYLKYVLVEFLKKQTEITMIISSALYQSFQFFVQLYTLQIIET